MSTDTHSEEGRTGENDDGFGTIDAVEVAHRPARLSAAMATAAAALAVLASAPASILGLAIGLFGLGGFAVGLFGLRSRLLVGVSTAVIFASVVAAGLFGNDAVLVVFGAFATVLAFDYSQNAFSVGNQLSVETETAHGEVVHAAASAVAGIVVVVVASAIYFLFAAQPTVSALAFVLLAAILLGWAIRS